MTFSDLITHLDAVLVIKRCKCGRDYTLKEWAALPDKGGTWIPGECKSPVEHAPILPHLCMVKGCATFFDHRDCACRSTLAIEIDSQGNLIPNDTKEGKS